MYTEPTTGRQYLSPVTYDQFGNFLLPGGDIYNMQWDMSRVGASSSTDAGGTNFYSGVFNNLMISTDEFSNWRTNFMIGNTLRAYFTPSTLKATNFQGIRWDASSRKNQVSLIASTGEVSGLNDRPMFGVHWQSILGDILKVGGTFVTRQRGTQSYSHQDIDQSISTPPRYVYLMVTDDSPYDTTNGPRVYDVRVVINGDDVTDNIPTRAYKVPDVLNSKRFYNDEFQKQVVFMRGNDPVVPKIVENVQYNSESWLLDLLQDSTEGTNRINNLFHKSGEIGTFGLINLPHNLDVNNPEGSLYGVDTSKNRFLEANGTDVIIYEFLIPKDAKNLGFKVLAANDYCIDIMAAMYRRTQLTEADWDADPFSSAWEGNWSIVWDGKHCAKAKGNTKDLSNMKYVTVNYDRLSGVNVYGLNMELNWRGLFLRAEYNRYNEKRSYPTPEVMAQGDEEDYDASAWFVNAEKDFGKFSVGGEWFDYPREYMRYWSFVDDNDDNDLYNSSATGNGSSTSAEYPGLDVDWDRTVDTTWRGEPYLLYHFDSISFGDDFNHNGIIDIRENDDQQDLPYERDSYGSHYFLKIKPRELTTISFGHYDVKQEYADGENLTQYLKFEHMQNIGTFAEIGVYHRTERTKDDYKSDQYYRQYWGPSGYFNNYAYKDAWVNTSMLHTKLMPFTDFNIINDVKYDVINRQTTEFDGTEDQLHRTAPKDIVKASFIHKADYTLRIADARLIPEVYIGDFRLMKTRRIKELKIQPMFKFVNSYFTRDLHANMFGGHSYSMYPILRIDYRVAPSTILRTGFQGFPGFPEIIRNTANEILDRDRRRMIVALENRSLYQGFNLLVLMGVRYDKEEWVDSLSRIEPGKTEYFITIRSETSN